MHDWIPLNTVMNANLFLGCESIGTQMQYRISLSIHGRIKFANTELATSLYSFYVSSPVYGFIYMSIFSRYFSRLN